MKPPPESPEQRPDPPLAYRDPEFLDSDEARPIRMLAEYLAPMRAFQREKVRDTIVFFGSARMREDGAHARFYAEARELARLVTEWSHELDSPAQCCMVCTGGGGGIMEAANRGAADASGRSIGLNIGLPKEQRPNPWITPELSFEFHYFFMRKLWFAHLARAIIAFPGGFGTLDELFELLTLSQTRKLERPIAILLYGTSYWDEVLNLEALARQGMVDPEDLKLIQRVDSPAAALATLKRLVPPEPGTPTPAFARSASCGDFRPPRARRRDPGST